MAAGDEIVWMSATELAERIRARELSPVEVVEAGLRQIERRNGVVNAVCTVSDRALADAREAEHRLMRGDKAPLLGVPFGIKDVTPTAGVRTTFGSPLFRDFVPAEDALVVSRLKEAGGILIGKTNTPEFAAGGNTFNEIFGVTRNPWNPALSAGGSTGGGAAALASGMIALAEGTDLGGSLRIPASFCGIVGMRPSPGLVPTYPSEFLWDNLQVSGPMARTVADLALMLQVVSGPTPLTPLSQAVVGRDFVAAASSGLGARRLAYTPEVAGIGVQSDIERCCRRAALDLAREDRPVAELDFDLSFAREAFLAIRAFWMVAHQHSRLDRLGEFGPNLAGNVRAGLELSMERLAAAEQTRAKVWEKFRRFFQDFDCLLTPCMAVSPFPAEQNYPTEVAGRKMATYVDWIAPTFVLSLTGLPVAAVPCGLDDAGMPVGMQVVGPPFGEETVLAVAREIESANPIGSPPE